MDYDKAYKEALKRAKELHESGNVLTKLQMGIVFPELKESEREDERIRKEIVGFVDKVLKDKNVLLLVADRIGDDIPNMISGWIAYLERWKEQKPAKWSEEDEKIRQSLINDLESVETEDEDVQQELNEKVAWLKSIHPQPLWKPSKEQVVALDKAIPVCMRVAGCDEIAPLESLYEQLKKLM